jgi:ubiquinol-cytochrome c reductase iron-sulfur subunit
MAARGNDRSRQPAPVPRSDLYPRIAGILFIVSAAASLVLAVVYALGGQPQLEGALLATALGSLGAGIILWAKDLLIPEQITEERETLPSPPPVRAEATAGLESGERQVMRRRALSWLLLEALAALGVAALFPIRSLGPSPGRSLFHTEWTPGARVVNEIGAPVSIGDLEIGSVITVYPEGYVGSPVSQALVVRVEPGSLQLPPDRLAWAPRGYIAFSKVCTHAGCPVGLYQETTHVLLCPCHQSTFDVLRGAQRVFGPAPRPLPQLPLEIAADGTLRARGDFLEPIGPSFWGMS